MEEPNESTIQQLVALLKSEANSHHDGTVARVFSELAKVLEKVKESFDSEESGE